ncbi:MAG TPA: SH3 domain-containing protein [Anaerolineales bacterium]|nr:SH3 domain-containing protein [Anaerolineales bacterium]
MTEEKKNLFDRAVDALTDRDEKAAKAAAEKQAGEKVAAFKADALKSMTLKAESEKVAHQQAATRRGTVQKAAAERFEAVKAAAAPKKGIVTIKSLRIRADHNTTSKVVGGLVDGNEVSILSTWSDGKNTWAKLDKGWAAMVYDGETYIKLA